MYQFVCEKLVPTCTYKSKPDTKEKTEAIGNKHMHAHHTDQARLSVANAIISIPR